jgi:hypothetical protein
MGAWIDAERAMTAEQPQGKGLHAQRAKSQRREEEWRCACASTDVTKSGVITAGGSKE